jgi:uncharacterized OsmC-like protein
MSSTAAATLDAFGDPLAFKVRAARSRAAVRENIAGRSVFTAEARQLAHHQKEAVVTQGDGGSAWRVTSDEGRHLNGTDLAPFPLGVFNAGLHGDLIHRLLTAAAARGVALHDLRLHLDNRYSLTGSFVRGDAVGYAEPTRARIRIASAASAAAVAQVVREAVVASPALAALRAPLESTFAIYVNGRRRDVDSLPPSSATDAPDPFRTWTKAPRPLDAGADLPDLIRRTGVVEPGTRELAPATISGRQLRTVEGESHLLDPAGLTETDTWLALPGASHFTLRTDERTGTGATDRGPTGLALMAAGIAFCYMTQLSRYIENMKLAIDGVRLVQYMPCELQGEAAAGTLRAIAHPVDTHLFLNGQAPDETHAKLQRIAATTCYLHATLAAALEPEITLELNGSPVPL